MNNHNKKNSSAGANADAAFLEAYARTVAALKSYAQCAGIKDVDRYASPMQVTFGAGRTPGDVNVATADAVIIAYLNLLVAVVARSHYTGMGDQKYQSIMAGLSAAMNTAMGGMNMLNK